MNFYSNIHVVNKLRKNLFGILFDKELIIFKSNLNLNFELETKIEIKEKFNDFIQISNHPYIICLSSEK
jgi:hypothetical protein